MQKGPGWTSPFSLLPLKDHWSNTKEIFIKPKWSLKWGRGQRLAVSQYSLNQFLSERWKMAGNLLATEPATEGRVQRMLGRDRKWGGITLQEILGWPYRTRRRMRGGGGTLGINHWLLSHSAPTPPWPFLWRSCQFGFPWPHGPSSHRWLFWFLCLRDSSTVELVMRFWNTSVIL